MTAEPPPRTDADAPTQWTMISRNETEPADLRLLAWMSDQQPEPRGNETGFAWFIAITRTFTGCPEPHADLERLATSWFEHSGLAPLLAVADANTQQMTFWKAHDIPDPSEAIRLTHEGITRAIEHTDLRGGVPHETFDVKVFAEREAIPQHDIDEDDDLIDQH